VPVVFLLFGLRPVQIRVVQRPARRMVDDHPQLERPELEQVAVEQIRRLNALSTNRQCRSRPEPPNRHLAAGHENVGIGFRKLPVAHDQVAIGGRPDQKYLSGNFPPPLANAAAENLQRHARGGRQNVRPRQAVPVEA
jgi:hypothetical protein